MRLYSIVYKIRRIEMQQIILGSAGFLLYFIYDINSVRKQNRLLQKFFFFFTILVVLSLFGTSYIHLVFRSSFWENLLWRKQITGCIHRRGVWIVSASRRFVVCRCISLYVGNVWRMETGNLFFTYDFLELSVYHFSGSVDFSADVF